MLKKHWVLIINLVILLFLLAKNPFSARTLIPNFEPYPDAIHYIVPARSFAQGGPFSVTREGRYIKPSVPPLYSVFLIPLFVINNDPRVFYFANVLLSIGGLLLLYAITKKLLTNLQSPISYHLVLFVSLFLYVTNYFIYWYPSLAMAENLTLFLFLLNLYIIVHPINKVTVILAGIIPFCFFLTKYANIPLTGTFLVVFGIKLFFDKNGKNRKILINHLLLFGGGIFTMLLVMVFTESFPGSSSLTALFGTLVPPISSKTDVISSGAWFSLSYIKNYLPQYVRALFGGYSAHFLWDTTPILPFIVATPGLIGLIMGMFIKKTRLLCIALIFSISSSIIFMSAFYSIDMRYIYFAIPTLIIGFALFWDILLSFLPNTLSFRAHSTSSVQAPSRNLKSQNITRYALFALLFVLFLFYFATSAIRLKKQVMLNLKYAETPWYYLSVVKLNEYFKNYPKSKKEPVVISAMIPYLIDFYSNGEYSLLPMSESQEFRNYKQQAWGEFDYTDLVMLYTKILYSGHEVYVHNYGIGNEKPLQDDFKKIQDNFILTKVASGCYDACNIWQLKIKYPLKKIEEPAAISY